MLKRSLALLFAAGMAAAATEVSAQPTSAGTPPNESASKIPQAGNVNRYVIPLFTSQSTQATRSFVAIGVRNNGTTDCNVVARFRFAFTAATSPDICVINLAVPRGQTRILCSRGVNDPVMPCSATCASPLTFTTGNIIIGSTNAPGCEKLAIDALQYYTRDPADDFVESANSLRIIKFGAGNTGD